MYLVVGLGNPGKQYEKTRHNMGFETIDALAKHYDISTTSRKHKALYGKGQIEGQKVLLAKPLTFMNLSGVSVAEMVFYYKIDVSRELIVIYDDIDLEPGRLRVRTQGSAGGHNGMKSIIAQLGTQSFTRIRVGVGGKPRGWDLADYVLGRFSKAERRLVDESIGFAAEAVAVTISQGADAAMNQYN